MAYRVCTRCVMDTTDPEITFDEAGVCNHCRTYDSKQTAFKTTYAPEKLNELIKNLKEKNKNKAYDCIVGVSGGVDSSYVLYKAVKEWNLRVLAVHVDAGWNSEVAVSNIEKLISFLNIKLHTVVIDWNEMKDLHLSFLKSGVPNQDIPQDHAFSGGLYKFAIKYGVRDMLSGHNEATESILPKAWGYNPMDGDHLIDIHRNFGQRKLKKFPLIRWYQSLIIFPHLYKFKIHYPLNYFDYSKDLAKKELAEKIGWKDYGGKHYESRFTKFFQSYFLPTKFGFDKRKAHLSSLILSGHLTRASALNILQEPLFDGESINEDIEYISKKLGISVQEFRNIIAKDPHKHSDYKTHLGTIRALKNMKNLLRL